jgi:hypothetical protein
MMAVSDMEGEEYRRGVSRTFRSEEEGFQCYIEYAKVKGFNVRKEEVKYLPRFRWLYTSFIQEYHTLANFERLDLKKTQGPKCTRSRCCIVGCWSHRFPEYFPLCFYLNSF